MITRSYIEILREIDKTFDEPVFSYKWAQSKFGADTLSHLEHLQMIRRFANVPEAAEITSSGRSMINTVDNLGYRR